MRAVILVTMLSLCMVATTSCSRTEVNPKQSVDPTVDVPPFAIAVKLSPKADERLRTLHESVKVIAYFDGDPLPGQGTYNPPNRDVSLGSDEELVDDGQVAHFRHATVRLSDWKKLADKDYFVTINTVSARRVVPDNLLDCADPMSQRIETFRDQTVAVQCWLIGESDAPKKFSRPSGT